MQKTVVFSCLLSIALCACSSAPQPKPSVQPTWTGEVQSEMETRYHPTIGTKGMVVADDPEAAAWGADILKQGGNAIDAAVATAFAMSVTRPHHSSIGGGGFMVYCPAPLKGLKQPCVALDYREKAPSKASRDMYLRNGKADTQLSQNGALAIGVPGVLSGLLAALEKFGRFSRQRVLSKPIELAQSGYRFSSHEEAAATDRWPHFNGESKRIWGCEGKPCEPGTLVRQTDLARVLEEISLKGTPGFYEGWVAKKIAQGIQAEGGILSEADLKAYSPRWLTPVSSQYKGYEVVSMPPPSAGGVVLLEMLGYAERADQMHELDEGYGSARTLHAITHGMSLAFADRAKHFGDPEFWNVPVKEMLDPSYLDLRWKSFRRDRAHLPEEAGKLNSNFIEGVHTTHFSVVDREGNAVAITTTVNDNFGSGFTPAETGIMMNNEMDDFSAQPGVPNLFGLVGAEANSIAPGKRPLSSMSPTVVRDSSGNVRIVIGAAGGPTITTSTFLSLVNRFQFGMSLPEAVAAARFHQQWKPAELKLERHGFSFEVRSRLLEMGYSLGERSAIAKVHALERFPNGRVWGVPDPRGEGGAVAE